MSEPSAFTPVRRLGTGAAGEVWLAEGPAGLVALKLAAPGRSLAGEIRSLAKVSHPNVPRLVDADPDARWLVRAYAEGQRLTSWSHSRGLDEVVATFAVLADAVHAVHAAGVIHGDLSPANVLVNPEGVPYLLDVGADLRGPAGALGWMAPERLRGENGTVASDIHSLGALLYAMTTGRPPYDRGGSAHHGWAAASTLPLPPSSIRAPLPGALEDLILHTLAWAPAARPTSAAAIRDAVLAAPGSPPRRAVVGMLDERDRLRRAVIEALRGEGGLYIVHGPAGSGRSTLMDEAARAASREGLPVHRTPLATATPALLASREAAVLVLDAEGLQAPAIAAALDRPTDAALVLVRSGVPVPALLRRAAVHMHPPPLSVDEIRHLAHSIPREDVDAAALWTRTRGHPGAVDRVLRGGDLSPHTPSGTEERLLTLLREGPAELPALAAVAQLSEHAVLDLLEPWMATGSVWSTDDGRILAADVRGLPAR